MPMSDRERAVIGTLSHNATFAPREIDQYTRFDAFARNGQPPVSGRHLVSRLLKAGLLKRVSRGRYFPTREGWAEIERDL